MAATNVLDDPLMFLPEVEKTVRRSGTTIWRDEKRGKFPRRHKQGIGTEDDLRVRMIAKRWKAGD